MRKLTLLGAAALIASTAAIPSLAQAACAQYDPTCATYPMPSTSAPAATRTEAGANTGSDQRQHRYRSAYRENRTAQRQAINNRYDSNRYYGPGDVVGGAVGTAGNIAAGAVNTAGAIVTAPFRGADSYAYYNNGYNGWNNSGFACTPGTYFRGADGRRYLCR